jgi:hypothetical protein
MRRADPSSRSSSTSTKAAVCGTSVGGLVKQARGVTRSAPKVMVCPILISSGETRPVTLSRAANRATEFEIVAAPAGAAERITARSAAARKVAVLYEFTRVSDGRINCNELSAAQPKRPAPLTITVQNRSNNDGPSSLSGDDIASNTSYGADHEMSTPDNMIRNLAALFAGSPHPAAPRPPAPVPA